MLRLPHELVRRNFKTSQRYVEREKDYLIPALKTTANAALSSTQTSDQTLADLDAMIARMQTMKRKLQALHEEEQAIQAHSQKRIRHLQDLYEIQSLADVKYDEWSRVRLDRLMVDYLLRVGYSKSAASLANEKHIEDLVDLDVFVQCQKVADGLERCETKEALLWCAENRTALKKIGQTNFEFELRLQQYIEMIRAGGSPKRLEAMLHAKKYLTPYSQSHNDQILQAAGLLAQPPDTLLEPYKVGMINIVISQSSTNQPLETILSRPVDLSLKPLHHNTSHPPFPTYSASPTRCTKCWSLGPQDTSLPFSLRIIFFQSTLYSLKRLSHLQHRAQRASSERTLRPPYEELCRARSHCVAEWAYIRQKETRRAAKETGRWSWRGGWWRGKRSNDW